MLLSPRRKSYLAVAAAIAILTACGKGDDKAATQVAARVNKEEISVHQINYVLSRSGNLPADQVQAASRQVLEKLIDQGLLMQKATSAKLDRDPNVMQSIENSRSQILAQSYLEKVMSATIKPTPEEVADYYSKHPELFSQRRLYRFQQLSIAGGKDLGPQVQQILTEKKSLADIAVWAQGKNLQVNTTAAVKAAEQLPLELLPKLHQMKDGQIGIIGEANGVTVLQLVASQEQPIDEKTATPMIEKFLLNKRKTELAEKEIKQLRSTAAIEYVGDFRKKDEAKPTNAEKPASAPVVQSPAAQEPDAVSKGLAGMK